MIFYIYQYTNLINSKIYIGQTNNFQRRVNEHKSCSFNPKSINYDDIIHKAIRKYGYDNFTKEIIETIDTEDYSLVNDREQYWIREKKSLITQWGYNVLEGGNNSWRSFLTKNDVKIIKKELAQGTSYENIQKMYPISKAFISDINNGRFFYDEKQTYPIYQYRISNNIYDALIEDLIKPELTFKELAIKYNLSESTVKKFNYGKLQLGYYQGEYPIRKVTPQEYKRILIKNYLINTNYSKKKIATLTSTSEETVRRINIGQIDKDQNLKYPLR